MSEWCLDVSEGQVRIGKVRTGQVRTGQVMKFKSRKVKTGQVKLEMHLRLEFDFSVGPNSSCLI